MWGQITQTDLTEGIRRLKEAIVYCKQLSIIIEALEAISEKADKKGVERLAYIFRQWIESFYLKMAALDEHMVKKLVNYEQITKFKTFTHVQNGTVKVVGSKLTQHNGGVLIQLKYSKPRQEISNSTSRLGTEIVLARKTLLEGLKKHCEDF